MYLSAQKKKIRPFEGFNRRAIVCIPTQEELKKRTEDRKKEGIELPENAVSDMKSMLTCTSERLQSMCTGLLHAVYFFSQTSIYQTPFLRTSVLLSFSCGPKFFMKEKEVIFL